MIYYLLYELLYAHFKDKEWYLVKALNVFQYVTFRTAYATITALLISLFFGGKLIDALKRWNVGQQIREEGPKEHQVKRGTPTMGGVLIVGSVLISTLLWARLSSVYVWTAMIATLLFGAIGFVDDYSKMAKQRSLGLTARQKLLAQLLVAVGVWAVLYLSTRFMGGTGYSWNFSIPFFKQTADPFGKSFIGPYVYLVLIIVVLLGSSNAVNLTDGLDGLAISVTFIAMTALTGFTYLSSDARWASYLELTHRPEAAELTVFCGAMGTVAVLTKQEFMLLMVGGVFVIEALSVMLQVSVFKMTKRTTGTGRRLFKMTPLHHHFEMQDWRESKIVFRFLILAILFALLSLSTLKLR